MKQKKKKTYLSRTSLRSPRSHQILILCHWVIMNLLRQHKVNHIVNVRNSDRALSNIGRNDHFSLSRRWVSESLCLLLISKRRMQGYDLQIPSFLPFSLNVLDKLQDLHQARHEDQNSQLLSLLLSKTVLQLNQFNNKQCCCF